MLVVIGLLILAVLLFGSARVLGALGAIAGFIALVAALAVIGFQTGIGPDKIVFGLAGLFVLAGLAGGIIEFLNKKK